MRRKEYEAAANKMHGAMTLPYSNDVNVDFVRGMIPHHQGAIDQATILLKYSKNPRLRRLAGGIIYVQRREMLFMQKWLEAHEKGSEMEVPEWLKNTAVPDDVREPQARLRQREHLCAGQEINGRLRGYGLAGRVRALPCTGAACALPEGDGHLPQCPDDG